MQQNIITSTKQKKYKYKLEVRKKIRRREIKTKK